MRRAGALHASVSVFTIVPVAPVEIDRDTARRRRRSGAERRLAAGLRPDADPALGGHGGDAPRRSGRHVRWHRLTAAAGRGADDHEAFRYRPDGCRHTGPGPAGRCRGSGVPAPDRLEAAGGGCLPSDGRPGGCADRNRPLGAQRASRRFRRAVLGCHVGARLGAVDFGCPGRVRTGRRLGVRAPGARSPSLWRRCCPGWSGGARSGL